MILIALTSAIKSAISPPSSKSQPKSCGVAVFFASNGTVQAASQFSTDHEAVAKSVRLPLGRVAAYSSIYLSLMDLIKRWPVTGARREVLLMADGIDRFRGDPFSPDVDTTIERAQRAGVMIHTLYASGIGAFSRNMFQVNYGQSNLAKMADGTGGEAFFQGLQTPISFAPFLDQLNVVLNNQYWLKFETPRSKRRMARCAASASAPNSEMWIFPRPRGSSCPAAVPSSFGWREPGAVFACPARQTK